jgi:RHS repeat-associated protein
MQAAAAKRALLSDGPLVTYLHQNHLGTTAATTDTQGEILRRTEHYPYGEVRHQSGMLEDYSWTGQERDRRIGLSYHSARYLDTWTGRWTAPDPLFLASPAKCLESPGQCSLYGYAQNNPVNAVDPTGFYDEDAHGALVYRLAIAAGWNWREAAQISLASASVDHRSDTEPVSWKNILTGATAKYHFASWADARRVMAAGLAGAGSDLNGFGRALHIWMDVGWKEAPGPHAAAGERGHGRLDIGHQLYFTETGELSTIFNHVTDKGYMNPGRSARQLAYVYGILRLGAKTWRPGSVGNQREAARAIRDYVTADTAEKLNANLDWTSKDAPFSYRQVVEANSRNPSLFGIGATWEPSEIDASRDDGIGVPDCPY